MKKFKLIKKAQVLYSLEGYPSMILSEKILKLGKLLNFKYLTSINIYEHRTSLRAFT